MIVTPGYTFTSAETVTHTKLNLAANPTVELEAGDIDADLIDIDSVIDSLGDSAAKPNYLHNGNFGEPFWSRGSSETSCAVDTLTYRADHWFCRPELVTSAGYPISGTVKYARATDGPDIKSLHCAQLTGDTGIAVVDFGQDIDGHLAAALRTTITVSFYLYNSTGAALTPSLRLETADSFNNFTSTTVRGTVTTVDVVQTGNWALFTFSVNCAAYTNITNGLRVLIRIPTGSLSTSGKSIRLSQVKLERGTAATPFVVERDDVSDTDTTAEEAVIPRNFAENPQFALDRWIDPDLTLLTTKDNFAAENWWLRPAGASTAVAVRNEASPLTSAGHCLQVTGETGVTTLTLGQNLEIPTAKALQAPSVFSIYIYNDTGADFTPEAGVDTCDSDSAFDDVTERATSVLDSCPDGEWTRVSFTFDGSLLTNWANGARVRIIIPTTALASSGQLVKFACAQLQLGVTASDWEPMPRTVRRAVLAQAKALYLRKTSAAVVTISADDVILTAADGQAMNSGALSGTVDITTSGVGGLDTGSAATGWQRFYAISDGTTTAVIAALSSTTLTLPAGYRFQAYLGEAYYLSTGTPAFRDFKQRDALGVQEAYQIISALPADLLYNAVSGATLAAALPPSAIAIGGTIGTTSGAAAFGTALSSSGTTTGQVIACGAIVAPAAGMDNFGACVPFWLILGDPQTLYWKGRNTGVNATIQVSEYELATR